MSNSMVFQWAPGSRYPVGAQIAAERLHHIRAERGEISPRNVVDDAADEDSPLHECFEWDNAAAADKFRLGEARHLIGSIVVAQVADQPVKRETRAFVRVTTDARSRYEGIELAMSQPDMRAEVLARAKAEISAWRARYAAYSEFAELHARIDNLFAAEGSVAA